MTTDRLAALLAKAHYDAAMAAYLGERGVRVSEDAAPTCCELACYEDPGCACDGCRSEDAAPQPDPERPSATWRPADRTVLAAMAPIVDGLCSGCGTKPSRETGSCRCLFRIDDVIRGADR